MDYENFPPIPPETEFYLFILILVAGLLVFVWTKDFWLLIKGYFKDGYFKFKKILPSKYPLKVREDGRYGVTKKGTKVCCPNCGGTNFLYGPEGGASVNVQCGSCYKYWNYMDPFGFQDIGDRSEIFGTKLPTNGQV